VFIPFNELIKNGVDIRTKSPVEKIIIEDQKVSGVIVSGKKVKCRAVVSNGNLKSTVHKLVGDEHFSGSFIEEARKVPHRRFTLHISGREIRFQRALQQEYNQPDFLYLLSGNPPRL